MRFVAALAALGLLTGCLSQMAGGDDDASLERAMAGQSQLSGSALRRAIAEAEKHPLGSSKNPVRAEMPTGEYSYLVRLRCGDGRTPVSDRVGSVGLSPFGNIMDGYAVDCGAAEPGKVEVHMDMYHPGHVETRPVPGFTIQPPG